MEENNPDLATIIKASYKPQREASADLENLGYKYDPELSSMENKVFVDKSGKPHIAYRGSVRASDWLGNVGLALGFKDPMVEKPTFPYKRKNHFCEWIKILLLVKVICKKNNYSSLPLIIN